MKENLRLARPYFILLGLVTLGRWLQGTFGVPYENGHHVFSIVILTVFSTIYYGAFTRRWLGYRLSQAMGLGFTLGLTSQIVILLATVVSYAFGLHTFFNYPKALNVAEAVGFSQALVIRLGGLVGNSIFASIGGGLGWVLGGAFPER
jgi:hypothetical protein